MNTNRLVFPGFWFDKTPLEEALRLARAGVGGFCLYGGTKQSVLDVTHKLRAASPHSRLLIAADYEDGLGRWLPDTPLLPSNLAIGAANNEKLSFQKGYLTATQARTLGVDWIFAPVLDLADNSENPIINTRSFGEDPTHVTTLARAFMKGLAQGGVLNSLKHFPGHGNTVQDSHLELPVVPSDRDKIKNALAPFNALLNEADSIMIGHLLIPYLDDKNPASLSPRIIKDLLQKTMGFHKCVCTDALLMKALGDEKQAALKAFNAGAHILLVPEKPFELMEFLQHAPLDEAHLKQAEQVLNGLCAKAEELSVTAQRLPIEVETYMHTVAQKGIVLRGKIPALYAGDTIHYLPIGNDETISMTPFLDTLHAHGLHTHLYNAETEKIDTLIVLFWRRYQAFKGKISLTQEEVELVQQAQSRARHTVMVCLANPWTSHAVQAEGSIFTFSPAPAFQQAAAECILGKLKPTGKLPITL